jgi:two-component system phosphate regulon response regulator PhoB
MMPTPAEGERILVVDDEPDIVALVVYHLAKAKYKVSSATSGSDALALAKRERPALVVLDLMLPGMSGFDVLEQLRADANTASIAVLMLTARKEEPDRIRGLELGADDYLTKPFSPQELVLRVGAILRRVSANAAGSDQLRIGPIVIDRSAHRVTVEGQEVELTPTEFKLLLTLAERRGRPRYSDANGGHACATPPHQAPSRRGPDRDGPRLRISVALRHRPRGVSPPCA